MDGLANDRSECLRKELNRYLIRTENFPILFHNYNQPPDFQERKWREDAEMRESLQIAIIPAAIFHSTVPFSFDLRLTGRGQMTLPGGERESVLVDVSHEDRYLTEEQA